MALVVRKCLAGPQYIAMPAATAGTREIDDNRRAPRAIGARSRWQA
jgi:hypothetical protein